MKNGLTVLTSPPPPPPPQLPTPKKGRKMVPTLIAIALIAIILVATVVAFYFSIVKWPFNPMDTTAPSVVINSPMNTTYGTASITINVTVTDAGSSIQAALCEVDSSYNATLIKQTGTSFYYNDMVSFTPDGSHKIRIYANDTAGNMNQSQTQFFTVGTTQPTNYGVVMGKVTDLTNNPVSNVKVSVGDQNSTTNDQGWFSISNVTAGSKELITFSKNGSVTTYKVTDVQVGTSSFIETAISNVGATASLNAATGGTATTLDNSSVAVGANSLVNSQNSTFTGNAVVSITTFDPSDENQLNAFPGEFQGTSAQNETGPIKSFGFMDVSVTDQNGQELQLSPGKTAQISIPVPNSMRSNATSMGTCPLWYFNPRTGIWHEEGIGTYNPSLGCFVGNVSHFSTWNYDIRYPAGYVSGRVVDSNGNPIQGAEIRCWGVGWYQQRWASGETSTNTDGIFTRIPVEVGVVFKYQASKGGHKSAILQAGPLAQNETRDVGDIVLDAPLVQITLTWGQDPRDLDSHLTARLNDNTTFHVYYSSSGSLSSEPYANLDTDDTTSYGPEVTSISRLRQGTYRYSVRHYAGSGTIETSGAEVNLVIPGVGIYRFTPPAGQPSGTDIWRIVDITVDSVGHVAAINPINGYVTGGDESELLYP
jgi:protocatechuate 3,4-dioxygenase beta subunit